MGWFSGRHRSEALYQDTTLVVPQKAQKDLGFSPWAFYFDSA
jgi:hypothetical protein